MHQRKRMSWYLRAAHWSPWDEAWNSTTTRHWCLKSPIYHYIFKNRRFFTKTEQIYIPSYCDALYWDWGHSRQRDDSRANWTITYCSCCRSSVVLYETVSKGQNIIRGLADKSDLSLRQADDYVADVQWMNPLWTQRSTVCWQRYSHHVPKYWPNGLEGWVDYKPSQSTYEKLFYITRRSHVTDCLWTKEVNQVHQRRFQF